MQDARKEADLVITDRIALELTVPADKVAWVEANSEFIAAETLATSLQVVTGEGKDVGISLRQAD